MPRRSLESVLIAFERSGVAGLEAIRDASPPSRGWIDALIAGVTDPRAGVPTTWMIRAYLARGVELSREQTAALLRSLARIEPDVARLHVCQLVVHLDIPARNAEQLARFLRGGISGRHKFTRAWALDALHRLALQYPRYRNEARLTLDRAGRDPAASVRARARRIVQESPP